MNFQISLPIQGILACLFVVLSFSSSYSQIHAYPENGGAGVAGTEPNSFLFGWKAVPNVIGYQYVVSDNPRCFVGCSGDTRFRTVTDTLGVEFNMQKDHWYYWITRIIYANKDTSLWSSISSFLTTEAEASPKMINPPNPIESSRIPLNIDWGLDPDAIQLNYRLVNSQGHQLMQGSYDKPHPDIRFDAFALQIAELPGGYYILEVRVKRANSLVETRQTVKLMIR